MPFMGAAIGAALLLYLMSADLAFGAALTVPAFSFPSKLLSASSGSNIMYLSHFLVSLGGLADGTSFEYCNLGDGSCHVRRSSIPAPMSGARFAVHNGSRIIACQGATFAGGSSCYSIDLDPSRQQFSDHWKTCPVSLPLMTNATIIATESSTVFLVTQEGNISSLNFDCESALQPQQSLNLFANESLVPNAVSCSAAGVVALAIYNASSGASTAVAFEPSSTALTRIGAVASLPAGYQMSETATFASLCITSNETDIFGFFVTGTRSDLSLLAEPFDLGLFVHPRASSRKLVSVAEHLAVVDVDGSVKILQLVGTSAATLAIESSRAALRHGTLVVSNEITISLALYDGFNSTAQISLSLDGNCKRKSQFVAPTAGTVERGVVTFTLPHTASHSSIGFDGSYSMCYSIGSYASDELCGGISTNDSPAACWQLGCFFNATGCFKYSADPSTSRREYFALSPTTLDYATLTAERDTPTSTRTSSGRKTTSARLKLTRTLTMTISQHKTTTAREKLTRTLSTTNTLRETPSRTKIHRRTRTNTSTAGMTGTKSSTRTPSKSQQQSSTRSLWTTPSSTTTETSTLTQTKTSSSTYTQTATRTSSSTATNTETQTQTSTSTITQTQTLTRTKVKTPSATATTTGSTSKSQVPTPSKSLQATSSHVLTRTQTLRSTRTRTKSSTLEKESVINAGQTGSSIQFPEQIVLGLGVVFFVLMVATMGVLVAKKILLQRRRARQMSYTSDFYRRFEESFTGVQADD